MPAEEVETPVLSRSLAPSDFYMPNHLRPPPPSLQNQPQELVVSCSRPVAIVVQGRAFSGRVPVWWGFRQSMADASLVAQAMYSLGEVERLLSDAAWRGQALPTAGRGRVIQTVRANIQRLHLALESGVPITPTGGALGVATPPREDGAAQPSLYEVEDGSQRWPPYEVSSSSIPTMPWPIRRRLRDQRQMTRNWRVRMRIRPPPHLGFERPPCMFVWKVTHHIRAQPHTPNHIHPPNVSLGEGGVGSFSVRRLRSTGF